jgi:transmembrane sensor
VLFTVAPDASRPFKVNVDADVLTAKGTQFAVRRDPAGLIKTFVLDGHVEVPNHNVIEASNEHAAASRSLIVDAGSAVIIAPTQTAVSKMSPSAVRERLAWTEGKVIVDGTLAEAVEELNRYNRRQLEIADPVYASRHIQGIFKTTDPDAFAQAVQDTLKIPMTSSGSAVEKTGFIRLGAIR